VSGVKVSSAQSHRLLVEAAIPVYRVSEVFSPTPSLYVLKHGVDFLLEHEARWAFRPVAGKPVPQGTAPLESTRKQPAPSPQGSKYDLLCQHLETHQEDRVTLSFKEVAAILGFPLPASAHKYPAFWANQTVTMNGPGPERGKQPATRLKRRFWR
jgi:hypothetical protein